jgi:hypothetical protein
MVKLSVFPPVRVRFEKGFLQLTATWASVCLSVCLSGHPDDKTDDSDFSPTRLVSRGEIASWGLSFDTHTYRMVRYITYGTGTGR